MSTVMWSTKEVALFVLNLSGIAAVGWLALANMDTLQPYAVAVINTIYPYVAAVLAWLGVHPG